MERDRRSGLIRPKPCLESSEAELNMDIPRREVVGWQTICLPDRASGLGSWTREGVDVLGLR